MPVCGFTSVYLLLEDVSQNVIVDIVNQNKTAVVRKNVLLKLLELLYKQKPHVRFILSAVGVAKAGGLQPAMSLTYCFVLAVHLAEERRQSDLQQRFLIQPPLHHSAVVVQLLLKHTHNL